MLTWQIVSVCEKWTEHNASRRHSRILCCVLAVISKLQRLINSKLGLNVITSGDANNLTETGISRVYNISNLPDGASIVNVFTIKYSADWISQIAFVLSPDAQRGAHVRQYVGGTTWTAWTKL